MSTTTELKKTPLNAAHRALQAKMVDFGGWDMPVQYPAGILAEHEAVRTRAGLFDVSHMGEFRVKGPEALRFLDWLTPNAVAKLADGQIHYTGFLMENGAFVDDLLIYRESATDFLLVVNAGNIDKDFAWVASKAAGFDVSVTNESDATGQIALQGPLAEAILQSLTKTDLKGIAYYHFAHGEVGGQPCLISRTGYTGEDGFEFYAPADRIGQLWDLVLAAGQAHGLLPAGLGCRNTLRLEAKMAPYGHQISEEIHALEAGLGRIVKFDKGDFHGPGAPTKAQEAGPPPPARGLPDPGEAGHRPGRHAGGEGGAEGGLRLLRGPEPHLRHQSGPGPGPRRGRRRRERHPDRDPGPRGGGGGGPHALLQARQVSRAAIPGHRTPRHRVAYSQA